MTDNHEHFFDKVDDAVAAGDREEIIYLQRLAEATKKPKLAAIARAADNYLVAAKSKNLSLMTMYESTLRSLAKEVRGV